MTEDNIKKKPNYLMNFIRFWGFIAIVWYFWGGGIENQVANDAVTQYGIAKKGGSSIDMCVQAGMVVAAYLQAKDEVNYKKWKKVQNRDCNRAGVPQ